MSNSGQPAALPAAVISTYSEVADAAQRAGDTLLADRLLAAARESGIFSTTEETAVVNEVIRLADALCSQSRPKKAEQMLEKTLKDFEDLFGKRNPKLCILIDHIASICLTQGKYAKALRLYSRAMAITRRVPGAPETSVVPWLRRIYHVHKIQGDEAEATLVLERLSELNR